MNALAITMVPQPAPVRLGSRETDSGAVAAWMLEARDAGSAEHVDRVKDQIWLAVVLQEQLRRTEIAERPGFTARADRLLEALDHPEAFA